MKYNKKRKAIVLSMVMAALMLAPLTMNAQYDEDKYGIQPWFGSSLMGKENSGNRDGGLSNQTFGEDVGGGPQTPTELVPLGGGLLIMMIAGAGYALLKKKED